MKTPRNPKQEGTNLFDCRPQVGSCPIGCNQCFYNRPGAFYVPIDQPNIPDPEEVGDGIIRMNCGHDSNIQRELVIETAKKYKNFFFNTSIPKFHFPGPVVFTANPKEEELAMSSGNCDWDQKQNVYFDRIMFVRLRVSPSNLHLVATAINSWIKYQIPVVLTFMAYYDQEPPISEEVLKDLTGQPIYEWRIRHINSYFCPTREFKEYVINRMKKIGGRLVTMCGTLDSNYCKDCMNCSTYYWQTMKHLEEIGNKNALSRN